MSCAHLAWTWRRSTFAVELLSDLGAGPDAMVHRVAEALEAHHVETAAHVRRIGRYSERLAWLIRRDREWAAMVGRAAVLHDLGKLAIPRALLAKAGPLTDKERGLMKTHAAVGARMLEEADLPVLRCAAQIARHHHERWDGGGYPGGVRGEECPVEARLVAVADVFDALREERAYKRAWSRTEITAYFSAERGAAFEPGIVDIFLAHYDDLEAIRPELRGGEA